LIATSSFNSLSKLQQQKKNQKTPLLESMHDCRNLLFADILSCQGFTQQLLLLLLLLLVLHRTLSRIYSISSSTTVAMIPAK
jgi:hypothetical protein